MTEEVKKPKIAIGLGMEFRLGPSRTMNISTHVTQDDSIEQINEQCDIIAAVAARQQALHEIEGWYDTIEVKTEELEQNKEAIENFDKGYNEDSVKLQKEWDEKHDSSLLLFQENWKASGRKGNYTSQPQHQTTLKNIDNSYQKKVDDLKNAYEANIRNTKANIYQIELIIKKARDSIAKRESVVNGCKKKLKLVNKG